jgi:hypothetical protein
MKRSSLQKCWYIYDRTLLTLSQGILTEEEGSVQLTSLYQPVQVSCYYITDKYIFLFF